MGRAAADRPRRRRRRSTVPELRVRSGLRALMNGRLWRCFHLSARKTGARLPRWHVNSGWMRRWALNRVNTLPSLSFTLNWTWRHCQVQSRCRGAKQNLHERNLPNVVSGTSGGRGRGTWGRGFSKRGGIFVPCFMSTAVMTRLKYIKGPATILLILKTIRLLTAFLPPVSHGEG